MNNNYFPKKEKSIEIPEFLQNKDPRYEEPEEDYISETAAALNETVKQGQFENSQNMYHMKQLDEQADAFTEEETRVVVKRLVSNYPDVVLSEVATLISDMQKLASGILRSSKEFATKRGEI